MTKFLISFPSSAMAALTDEEVAAASIETRRVVDEAKSAGVWVFGGAIDDGVPAESVSMDGTVTTGDDAVIRQLDGGFALLELPSIDDARFWAARLAAACQCSQEVRAFHNDPAS